jgi:hypothetical protein
MALDEWEDMGRLMHTLRLILSYSKFMRDEISTLSNPTKNLQLEKHSQHSK